MEACSLATLVGQGFPSSSWSGLFHVPSQKTAMRFAMTPPPPPLGSLVTLPWISAPGSFRSHPSPSHSLPYPFPGTVTCTCTSRPALRSHHVRNVVGLPVISLH